METFKEILSHYTEVVGVHPAAEILPMANDDDLKALIDDVKKNGLAEAIHYTSDSYLLLDGRNRLIACYEAQVEPRWKRVDEEVFNTPEKLADYVLSLNLARRHLSTADKAFVALELEKYLAVEAKKRQAEYHGNQYDKKWTSGNIAITAKQPTARDQAAKRVGIGGRSVQKAKFIDKHDPDVRADISSGKESLESAYKKVKSKVKEAEKQEPKQAVTKTLTQIVTINGSTLDIALPKSVVFNKTNENVDWAGYTWNPVTGCEHGCKFCYAEDISKMKRMQEYYPFGFTPTFHEYRLQAPKNTPVDGRVFVCSMADLFGKWVPDEWINKVFDACMTAPQWEYMFLTKWPNRYKMLESLPKAWFGASIIKQSDVARVEREMQSFKTSGIKWISLEPMLESIRFNDLSWCDVVVIGSQTAANGQPAIAPQFDWIVDVVNQCRESNTMYYLKPNLMEVNPGMIMNRDMPAIE